MLTVVDVAVGSVLTTWAALYICLPAAPIHPEPVMNAAARKVDILLDELITLTKGFQGQYESEKLDRFEKLFSELLHIGDPQYRLIWPKSVMLQNELDDVFNHWVEAGANLKQKIESLPRLTVNTVDRWISIKDEVLKFEIKSADFDFIYGMVSRTPSQIKFTKKAIALRDLLEARAGQTLPQFPDQFPNQVIEAQIRFWSDHVRDMTLDPVLKEIALGVADHRLKQMERRRILEED